MGINDLDIMLLYSIILLLFNYILISEAYICKRKSNMMTQNFIPGLPLVSCIMTRSVTLLALQA